MVLTLFASVAFAQSLANGALEGTVADASGAVIPDAQLTLKNIANGTSFDAKSSNSGFFAFPVVPVGNYELTATKTGFTGVKVPAVVIQVGNKSSVALTMKVAAAGENVTVTADAELVETTRTSVADNVNQKTIENIPTLGRNFIDFVLLTPGVTKDNRTGDISFAGQRGTMNSLTVDGADNNNSFFGQTTGRAGFKAPSQFSQDSVKEFQVASNAYSAELGRAGGAVINVVTKSGTNQFHGDAFEFYRDQSLNAYDPIQKQNFMINPANAGKPMQPKNKYHFNQFGGDIGGPIVKNKLFFFFDIDDQRNTNPNIITSLPALTTFTSKAGLTAQDIAYITTGYNYLAARQASWNRTLNQNTYLLKLDYNLSQRNILSARWNRQRFTAGNQENAGAFNSVEHTGDSITHTDTATFSLTSTLTNSLVNVARFTYLKDVEPGVANSPNPEAVVLDGGQSLLTVGRNSFSPRATNIHHQQYADNMTWAHSHMTLKFGGDAVVDKIFNYFPGNFFGAYRFNSLEAFGQSLSGVSFPIGSTLVSYAQAFPGANTTGPITAPDILQGSFFAQSDYRVTQNLTINAGLRYDIQSVKQPTTQNAAAEAIGFDTSKVPIKKNEWGPRFGFAYTPMGNQRFVVRGGYGFFYATTPSLMIGTAHSNNGINVATYTLAAQPYSNAIYASPAAGGGGTTAAPSIYVFAPNFQNPRVQQGNLGVEYAIDKNTSINVNYLRVKADHLQRTADVNLGATTAQTITDVVSGQTFNYDRYLGARPYPAFARISQFQSTAGSNFNGMSAELKRRFSSNFQGSISYTWSHVIDNAPDATAVVPFSSGDDAKIVMYTLNPNFDRGNGINDQRHRFVTNFVWDLNYGKNLPKFAHALTSGWTVSGILQAAAGQPYSSVVGSDLNSDSNNNDRLPSTGRNSFTLPATWELDPRISRTIKLGGETRNLQLFAEAFNIFNHFNVNGVRNTGYALKTTAAVCGVGVTRCLQQQNKTTAPTAYFGLPTSDVGPRTIQLGAKINF